jgi:hypothetical protein
MTLSYITGEAWFHRTRLRETDKSDIESKPWIMSLDHLIQKSLKILNCSPREVQTKVWHT